MLLFPYINCVHINLRQSISCHNKRPRAHAWGQIRGVLVAYGESKTKSIKAALIQSAVCLPLIYLIVASLTRISTSQDIAFIVTTIPIITSGCIYPIES